MRKTGRENGRKNDQRRSGNESSRGKNWETYLRRKNMMRRKGRRRKEGKMRERRKNGEGRVGGRGRMKRGEDERKRDGME